MNDRKFSWQKILLWVIIFSIAMGFLETAVVVYLRHIYYPQGFKFPLAPIDTSLVVVEVGRELATIIMLLGVGAIAGRTFASRFAYFILSFAIWDIFYYVFLKVLLDWPASWMTWDILFLIPTTWIGPVLAPVIVSITMIGMALIIVITEGKGRNVWIDWMAWVFLIAGALVLVLSFIWDYSSYMIGYFSFKEIWTMPNEELYKRAYSFVPRNFSWLLFSFGEIIIVAGIIRIMQKTGLLKVRTSYGSVLR